MDTRPEIAPGITVSQPSGFGKPVIKGSEVEVAAVLAKLSAGASAKAAARELGVSTQGILAALGYAYDIVKDEPASREDVTREVAPGVTADGRVRFGKPVIKGTRVDVATVLGHLAAGDSLESVAAAYGISDEGVRAALSYGLQIVSSETVSAL